MVRSNIDIYGCMDLQEIVSAMLCVNRKTKVMLYELTIYNGSSHFDWHKDTDCHHVTVLLALNTSLTGGDFILRCNGVETCVNLKPTYIHSGSRNELDELGGIAFYTDAKHKVEPVSDGVRITRQFDFKVG